MISEIDITLVAIGAVGIKPLIIKQISPKLFQTSFIKFELQFYVIFCCHKFNILYAIPKCTFYVTLLGRF